MSVKTDTRTDAADDTTTEPSHQTAFGAFTGIDTVVLDALTELQETGSPLYGTIVDIAGFTVGDPYQDFDIDTARVIGESERLIERIIDHETYPDCILVAVALPANHTKDVFVHPFTYESSNNDAHESIVGLCQQLNVDVSMVHRLVGKQVIVARDNNKWNIVEHRASEFITSDADVTVRDVGVPVALAVPVLGLATVTSFQTSVSLGLGLVLGGVASVIVATVTAWLHFAVRRDHPLPSVLGKLTRPSYPAEPYTITVDRVTDLANIELTGVTTLADETEHDNPRVVLHNLAVTGIAPGVGEVAVPVSCPRHSWDGTRAKQVVYYIAPSVSEIDTATGDLFPVTTTNRVVTVDPELYFDEPEVPRARTDELADAYVKRVNNIFSTPDRAETYNV